MDSNIFGERLRALRSNLDMTQKEFAEYIGIPQPSMSSYENGKSSPTIDVVMQIANICNISIDWLCGRDSNLNVGNLSDVTDFFYQLLAETADIGCDLEIHDKIDIEKPGETDPEKRWYTRLTFYGNDREHKLNSDLCTILRKVSEARSDIESFSCSPESYEAEKKSMIEYFDLPITKKKIPNLTREERLKKHIEYLKEMGEI